jgi:hypothetical protein
MESKTMGFDVAYLLESLFGGPATIAEPAPEAVPVSEAADTVGDPLAAAFADWVLRPDCHGCMGWQAPRLPEAVPFDALPLPGPACAVCGSLESWQNLLGRERCGSCDRDGLDKALRLADKAAQLRRQAQPRKPAPRIAPGCVAAGRVDTLDLDSKRPLQSQPEGLAGRETGQGGIAEGCNGLRPERNQNRLVDIVATIR